MSVQILGGFARSNLIKIPPGDRIRPMSVTLKRRIFDAYQNLEDYTFIDACAGSGAVGLESLSRGAVDVYFFEKDPKVYQILKLNIQGFKEKFKLETEHCTLHYQNKDLLKWLDDFKELFESWTDEKKSSTIFFFAPPYPNHRLYETTLFHLKKWYNGNLWIESDRQKGLRLESIHEIVGESEKIYEQGTTFLATYSNLGK